MASTMGSLARLGNLIQVPSQDSASEGGASGRHRGVTPGRSQDGMGRDDSKDNTVLRSVLWGEGGVGRLAGAGSPRDLGVAPLESLGPRWGIRTLCSLTAVSFLVQAWNGGSAQTRCPSNCFC